MRIGIAFPTTEITADPAVIGDFFQAVEALGYDHVTLLEHVLATGTPVAEDWRGYYTREKTFHEPFVLYAFAAALTTRLELATAILILPQRQTALVAKQAAELDALSGGRLRLGVGLGWNKVEFDCLGENFHDRGRRIEEQVAVLRRLWTEELVSFQGEWHQLEDVGLNPLPCQRPIPVWFGGFAAPALRRAGRIGDGLLLNPRLVPNDEAKESIDIFREAASLAGREAERLGLDATIWAHQGGPNEWQSLLEDWRQLGASHVTFRTLEAGFGTAGEHLDAARRFREAIHSGP